MESDPTGRNPHEPGAKLDAGKSSVYQGAYSYFPRALAAVAEVSQYGATKYTWKGWESVPDGINRYENAMGRHIGYEVEEGPQDKESGLLHKAHRAWNDLASLELYLRQREAAEEDRRRSQATSVPVASFSVGAGEEPYQYPLI